MYPKHLIEFIRHVREVHSLPDICCPDIKDDNGKLIIPEGAEVITNFEITDYMFTVNEVKALYRLLSHQWINRKDDELNQVTDRITRIVNDISRRDSSTT